MAVRAEPLSIELLLAKQRKEKEETSKPKFLSKEERATLAIARRAAEIKDEKEKQQRQRDERANLERQVDSLRASEAHPGRRLPTQPKGFDDRDKRHRERREEQRHATSTRSFQNVPTGPRAERLKSSASSSHPSSNAAMPPPPPPAPTPSHGEAAPPPPPSPFHQHGGDAEPFTPPMTDNDMSAIRTRYLGVVTKKRKIRKMNDRKFVFDWDEQEDTFASDAPGAVGAARQGAMVMFGRGHLAGMDGGGRQVHGAGSGDAKGVNGSASLTRTTDAMERRKAARSGFDERHWTDKPLSEMKDRDWRIFREDFSISTKGGNIPNPLRSWAESEIPQEILGVIEQVGYKEPSAIQRQAIPLGLQRRDGIGIAETGSGKTASFVIPMLTYILTLPPFTEENRHMGPYALILAPTRELAQQIESESAKFARPLGFKCVSIVGGHAVEEQQFHLREGAEIIIATPGRLKDVLERHVIVLSQCTYVVMDEADRMVNLGFEVDLNFILDRLPSELLAGEDVSMMMQVDEEGGQKAVRKGRTRVTTLFSATMPPAVERLARKYLKKPAMITIGEAGRAVDTVEQRVEFVSGDEKKKQRMLEILNNDGFASPIIVFVNQKKTADMVAKDLQRAGWHAATLHSGKNQEQREASLASLRNGESDVLVATDLAGRGIDVQDVSLVINYQMAGTIEAYVHRIGRTGRAGKLGTAITFLTNDDDEVMYDLKQEIGKSPVSKVPAELARHEAAQQKVSREMKRKRETEDGG